jgi:hypothetical protein
VCRNGAIRFTGKIYTSPSVAGAAAVKRRTGNGWTLWKYERVRGLDETRCSEKMKSIRMMYNGNCFI